MRRLRTSSIAGTGPASSKSSSRRISLALESAALALLQIGTRAGSALAEPELSLARASGAPDTVGQALHVLGTVEEGAEGLRLLEESVEMLETSQAVLVRARALIDFGTALRKTSKQRLAREPLKRGLDRAALSRRCAGSARA